MKVLLSLIVLFTYTEYSYANRNTSHQIKEDTEEAANDTARAMRRGARKVEDKTCPMVNGKMKCAAKKVRNKARNAGDKIEDSMD